MTRYFFRLQSQQRIYGPFTASELRGMASSGRLKPSDLISPDDPLRWIPATLVRGLKFPDVVDPFAEIDPENDSAGPSGDSLVLDPVYMTLPVPSFASHELTVFDDSAVPGSPRIRTGLIPEGRPIEPSDIARAPFCSWSLAESGVNCALLTGWTILAVALTWLVARIVPGPVPQILVAVAVMWLAMTHLLRRYVAMCRTVLFDNDNHGLSLLRLAGLTGLLGLTGPIPLAGIMAALAWAVPRGFAWTIPLTVACIGGTVWTTVVSPMIVVQLSVTREFSIRRAVNWVWRALADVLAIIGGLVAAVGLISAVVILGLVLSGQSAIRDPNLFVGLALVVQLAGQSVMTAYYIVLCLAVRRNGLAGTIPPAPAVPEVSSWSTFSVRSFFSTAGSPL